MKPTFLVIALLLLTAGDALAQCSNGRCFRPRRPLRPANAQPFFVQATEKPTGNAKEYFGVDTLKLTGQDAYTVYTEEGCRHISKQQAHKIVGQSLQDDSTKLRITVIGDDGQQKKVLADIQSLLQDINDWAVLRGYPPNHWALEPGFVTTGSPTIYCQAPSGKVLHRQDDYQGGGEATVAALRKAKAGYDAKKDPDLRKTQLSQPDNGRLLSYGIAAVAGAAITHLAKRRKP